ncbi:diguanylate cyclase [Thioalkalivibrio sp. ARh3]|uniref:GGDEF domain-containing protein n=1 Tax=Thioalkalivibrio sp. ARh3 TaxID=1158148 RepID=UPI00037971DB|nr:GGDEF domain-containing protein [Thioalkalivibrio sp. ARh3]
MPQEPASDARQELENLAIRKRRVYLGALALAVLIMLLSWLFRDPDDYFLGHIYPVFAILTSILLVLVWRAPVPLRWLEIAMVTTLGALVLGRLAWHHHVAGPIDQQLLVLAGGHYWAVGALIVGVFVMLDRRYGVLAGSILLLASAVITVTGVLPDLRADRASGEALMYLLRVHVFLALLLVLVSAVAGLRDQLQRALVRAEVLDHWASTDVLTDLANRRAMDQFLRQQMATARRRGQPLSVILVDLDHFKRINDTHGHNVGDQVIQETARRLERNVRESDLVARWGGEEFLIALPGEALPAATRTAERCRSTLSATPIAGVEVTATFGVAELKPDDGLDELLRRADRRMYRGKATGRNRVIAQQTPDDANQCFP